MNKRAMAIVGVMLCILLVSGCGITKPNKVLQETKHTMEPMVKPDDTPEATASPITTQLPSEVKKLMDKVADINNWKTAKGTYCYPVKRKDLFCIDTVDGKYAVCQIPSELLKNIHTKDLLELVFACPMFDYISYRDTIYQGIMDVAEDFNGLRELINRPDFYKTVVKFYKHMKVPHSMASNLDERLPDNPTSEDYAKISEDNTLMEKLDRDMNVIYTICFCETVLTTMTDNVDASTLKAAKAVLEKKISEVKKTEFYEEIEPYRWGLKENSLADKRMVVDF